MTEIKKSSFFVNRFRLTRKAKQNSNKFGLKKVGEKGQTKKANYIDQESFNFQDLKTIEMIGMSNSPIFLCDDDSAEFSENLNRNLIIHPLLLDEIHANWNIPPPNDQKTLVLDLDETLIHSSFIPIENPDFVIQVF